MTGAGIKFEELLTAVVVLVVVVVVGSVVELIMIVEEVGALLLGAKLALKFGLNKFGSTNIGAVEVLLEGELGNVLVALVVVLCAKLIIGASTITPTKTSAVSASLFFMVIVFIFITIVVWRLVEQFDW